MLPGLQPVRTVREECNGAEVRSGTVVTAILYTLNSCVFGGAGVDRPAVLLVGRKYSISQVL